MDSMDKPLFYSAELKIKRANHHIQELVRVLNGFEQSGFHRVSGEGDAKTTSKNLTFEVTDELLEKIALIIGDVAHNLRTALDHVAYELVVRSGGTPTDRTKFPFGKARQETITTIDGVIQGICLDIITCIIECIQPYPGGKGDILYSLHRMDITDKHRLIVPIFHTVGYKFALIGDDGSVFGYIGLIPGENKKARLIDVPPGPDGKSYRNPLLHVLFDNVKGFEGRPVIKTLHEVRQLVAATVEEVKRAYLESRKASCLGRA